MIRFLKGPPQPSYHQSKPSQNACQRPQLPYQAEQAQKWAAACKARTPYKPKGELLTQAINHLRD